MGCPEHLKRDYVAVSADRDNVSKSVLTGRANTATLQAARLLGSPSPQSLKLCLVLELVLVIAMALVADAGAPSAQATWADTPTTESEYLPNRWQWRGGELQQVPPAAQQVPLQQAPQQGANFP